MYPEGHPKRVGQDSQKINTNAPSPSNKKKKKTDRTLHAFSEPKIISKDASMVKTQVEQVLKAHDDFLNELNDKNNDNDVRVATITGKMTQEPLYPAGHPKRIEQDSQTTNVDAPSPSKRKKKKNDRTLHADTSPTYL